MSAGAPTTIDAAKDALKAMIAAADAFPVAEVYVGRGGSVDPPRQRKRVYVGGYRNWRISEDEYDNGPQIETYDLVLVVEVHLLNAPANEVEHAAWQMVSDLTALLDRGRGGDPTLGQTVRTARLSGGMNEQSGPSTDKGYIDKIPLLLSVEAVLCAWR